MPKLPTERARRTSMKSTKLVLLMLVGSFERRHSCLRGNHPLFSGGYTFT